MNNKLEGIKVAIVDDKQSQARTVARVVEDAGMIPLIITEGQGEFTRPQDLMELVVSQDCAAVVCDHRLTERPFASFFGAEFVARSFRMKIPGVLLSTYASEDARTTIRLHRADIPSVVRWETLDPEPLRDGLLRCLDEIGGWVEPEREPWRVMVRVSRVTQEASGKTVWAVMHTLDPDREVQFPHALIEDLHISSLLRIGFEGEMRLFADVNVECLDEDDLFFKEFELAPEPDEFEFAT